MNKDIFYEEIWELVSKIIDKIRRTNDDEYSVGIIAKYPEAKEIIKEFIMCDADIHTIDLENPDVDSYEDEYYISVGFCDGGMGICCYPLKDDGEYYDVEDNIVYVFGDCNSRVYNHCDVDEIHAVYIGEDKCDCNECTCCKDEPYVINVKVNLGMEEAEDIIKKVRNDFYKEIGVFKKLLDF